MNITLEFRRDDMISAYGEASEDFQVVSMQRVGKKGRVDRCYFLLFSCFRGVMNPKEKN